MAISADQRLLQLLDIWLESLELHLRYASLDADSYAQVQPWPPHQRPTRWIIDIARQKALALKALIEERVQMGDSKFSDALEMTMFLANLVGVQHIERFIPLATPANERVIALAPADTGSMSLTTNAEINLPERLASAVTGTREMPQFVAKTRAPPPAGTANVARVERSVAAAPAPAGEAPAVAAAPVSGAAVSGAPVSGVAGPRAAAPGAPAAAPGPRGDSDAAEAAPDPGSARAARGLARGAPRSSGGKPSPGTTARAAAPRAGSVSNKPTSAAQGRGAEASGGGGTAGGAGGEPSAAARAKVLADAERLLQWGRKWYELAELIARMADRPSLSQVRRILKDNKSMLDAKFKR